MGMTIKVAIGYDDNGESIMETLPAKFIVCPMCEGHGTVLNPSMRNHCYSFDEFNETFHDDEDRAAYFQRGSKYDVQCPNCKGKNVVLVVDEDACASNEYQQNMLKAHAAWQDELWQSNIEDTKTMRGECGIWDH